MNRYSIEALAEWVADYARKPEQIGIPDVKLSEAAEQLRSLAQQRAELLEALKEIERTTSVPFAVVTDDGGMKIWNALCSIRHSSVSAIAKAES